MNPLQLLTTTPTRPVLGIPQHHYSVDRNILSSTPLWLTAARPRDIRRCILALRSKLGIPASEGYGFLFTEPFFPRVDLLHTFNALCNTATPWICSFESSLPRFGSSSPPKFVAQASQLLLQPNCKQLIAFSEATLNLAAIDWRSRMHSRQADEVLQKTIVLHPPQPVLETFENKPASSDRRFLFVGRDFYRKGGLQVLEAMNVLKKRGFRDWQATIIGDLERFGDYASRTTSADRTRAKWLLDELADVVTHHCTISHTDVQRAMSQSDFYLLPTLADTYGYGVLEAQAHGTVCVTTNVRALPELVSEETGFCLALPLDEFRNAHSHPRFDAARRELVNCLVDILVTCLKLPAHDLKKKADAATLQLRSCHNPETHRDRLDISYRRALGRL